MTWLNRVAGRRFYLQGLLGVGGTSAVFEAEDLLLQRVVAVKMLLPHVRGNADAAERLRREGFAMARVNHPSVAPVIDLGSLEDGSPFLVMERLVGESLFERIVQRGKLPIADAVDVTMQLLSGLSAIHDAGLVHRDVKPANVFLLPREGHAPLVKIIDFGAATLLGQDAPAADGPLTADGLVMGTPSYLSPEQVRGDRDFYPSVDIYATGVVLYEMLTGKLPFEAIHVVPLFYSIVEDPVPSIREKRPEVPNALEAVVLSALAKNRRDRPASAIEMQSLLVAAMERASIAAPTLRPYMLARRPLGRRPAGLPASSPASADDLDAPTLPGRRPEQMIS